MRVNTFSSFIREISMCMPPIGRLSSNAQAQSLPTIVNGDAVAMGSDRPAVVGTELLMGRLDLQLASNIKAANDAATGNVKDAASRITRILAVSNDEDIYANLLQGGTVANDKNFFSHSAVTAGGRIPVGISIRGDVSSMSDSEIFKRFYFGAYYAALPPMEDPSFGVTMMALLPLQRQAFRHIRSKGHDHLRLYSYHGLHILRNESSETGEAALNLFKLLEIPVQSGVGNYMVSLIHQFIHLRDNVGTGDLDYNPLLMKAEGSGIVDRIQPFSDLANKLRAIMPSFKGTFTVEDYVDGVAHSVSTVLMTSLVQAAVDAGVVLSRTDLIKLTALCIILASAQPAVGISYGKVRVSGSSMTMAQLITETVGPHASWVLAGALLGYERQAFSSFLTSDVEHVADITDDVLSLLGKVFNRKTSIATMTPAGLNRLITHGPKGAKAPRDNDDDLVEAGASVTQEIITKVRASLTIIQQAMKLLL